MAGKHANEWFFFSPPGCCHSQIKLLHQGLCRLAPQSSGATDKNRTTKYGGLPPTTRHSRDMAREKEKFSPNVLQYSDTRFRLFEPCWFLVCCAGNICKVTCREPGIGGQSSRGRYQGVTLLSGSVDLSAFGSSICCDSFGRDVELGQEEGKSSHDETFKAFSGQCLS